MSSSCHVMVRPCVSLEHRVFLMTACTAVQPSTTVLHKKDLVSFAPVPPVVTKLQSKVCSNELGLPEICKRPNPQTVLISVQPSVFLDILLAASLHGTRRAPKLTCARIVNKHKNWVQLSSRCKLLLDLFLSSAIVTTSKFHTCSVHLS